MAGDEAFGFQQFVGGGDGGPVQSKLASQFTSGGQPTAFGKVSGFNEIFNFKIELAVEVEWRRPG